MKGWQESGGGAFPFFDERVMNTAEFGMTLRDYFAAKAMASMLDKHNAAAQLDPSLTACCAYRYADAMLRERAK